MSRFLRGFLVVVVGLALAFGVFYFAAWPSSLEMRGSSKDVDFGMIAPGLPIQFSVRVYAVGKRDVKIRAVRLIDPSPGLELVSVHMDRADPPGEQTTGASSYSQRDGAGRLRAAQGSALEGGDNALIVVTLRASSIAKYRLGGVIVRYQSGWLTRTAELRSDVTVRVYEGPTPPPPSLR